MNKAFQVALGAATVAILLKFLVYTLEWPNHYNIYGLLLLLIVAGFSGIYFIRQQAKESLTFIMEFKSAMQPIALFVMLHSLFLWVYYNYINPTFLSAMHNSNIQDRIKEAKANGWTAEEINKMVDGLEGASVIYEPFVWSSITLFLLLFGGIFYSLLITAVLRNSSIRDKL